MGQLPFAAILLDLDETILFDDAATETAFAATAAYAQQIAGIDPERLIASVTAEAASLWQAGPFPEWCHDIGTSEVEGLRSRFDGEERHWVAMRNWGTAFRHVSWKRALRECGVSDRELVQELDARFEQERAATNPFIPGAQEALAALGERYRLAIVTNGIPDVQWTKLNRTGLTELFEVVVISGELGVGKPDPRIYEETLRQLGLPADACLMVGDNFRRDVAGAQDAGIPAVWIAAGRPSPDPSVTPFLTVDTLAELPAALGLAVSPTP